MKDGMGGKRPKRRGVLQNVLGMGLFSWLIPKIKRLLGLQDDSGGKSPNETTNESKPPHADQEQAEEPDEKEDPEPTEPENGAIVFVYDDGPMEDYTQAFPAHEEFDAPATIGIVSDWVGTSGYMDTEHLDELVEAGWEIASHTEKHRPLASFPLTEDTHSSDTIVSAEGYRHGHHEGETVEINNGETKVLREIAGLAGKPGERRVKLTEPVGKHFHAGETEIHYPAEVMHEAVDDSKTALEEMGYDVSTILAPYDAYSGYSNLFVKEQYDGVANADHGSRINDPESFDPYETQRDYFIEFTNEKSVKDDLDEIADDALLGMVGAHSSKDGVNEESIREMLEWVEERDIEVMTLRDAISMYAGEPDVPT